MNVILNAANTYCNSPFATDAATQIFMHSTSDNRIGKPRPTLFG